MIKNTPHTYVSEVLEKRGNLGCSSGILGGGGGDEGKWLKD